MRKSLFSLPELTQVFSDTGVAVQEYNASLPHPVPPDLASVLIITVETMLAQGKLTEIIAALSAAFTAHDLKNLAPEDKKARLKQRRHVLDLMTKLL